MIKYVNFWLLVFILIVSLQINAKADSNFNEFFNKGRFIADKFVDSVTNNEIEVDNEQMINTLENLPTYDLLILRNTFFAKHGYIFKTSELKEYFLKKLWYILQAKEVALSAKEKKFVSLIRTIETGENVNFDEFRKLFTPLYLPFTYEETFKRNPIDLIMVRKYFKHGANRYIPYVAIGELYKNNKFIVLIYEISSLETQVGVAIFSLDGNLISDKIFITFGDSLIYSISGELFIDEDLKIHVEIKESSFDSDDKEIIKNSNEKYRIDLNGKITKIS